ncbi:hypothetical protein [Micromonospora sp. DT62]|uniref:hypothetical protein n=1 Tax=Micromonospora sp. DT62 TaxID=3416521 RepID=UPI003CF05066
MASTLAATGGFASAASADLGPLDHCTSVDGGELVYDDFTKYNNSLSHAVNQWNSRVRPFPQAWPRAGDRGDGLLPGLLQPEHEQQPAVVGHQLVSQRMGVLTMKRLVRPLVAGAAVVAVASGGWLAYDSLRPGETHSVHSSYAFDVKDETKVAGFADYVVVATVDRVVEVQERDDTPYTVFEVTVDKSLKGEPVKTLRVVQLGGTLGKDTWRVEGEPLLRPGTTYVLAAKTEQGRETHQLVGGADFPVVDRAAARAGGSGPVAEWQDSVARQRWPEELPKKS